MEPRMGDAMRLGRRWKWRASPDRSKGFTPSRRHRNASTVGRKSATAVVLGCLIVGPIGLVVSLGEIPPAGIVADNPGGSVQWVDPDSFEWQAGIRAGQQVVAESAADDPGGWFVETADQGSTFRATSASAEAHLRAGTPFAALATILGATGLAWVGSGRKRAELLGVVALAAAWVPFWLAGQRFVDPALSLVALLGPPWWLSRWSEFKPSRSKALIGAAVLLVVASLAARDRAPQLMPAVDVLRVAALITFVLIAVAVGLGVTPATLARRASTVRLFDAVTGASLVIGLIVLRAVLDPPFWLLAVAALSLLFAYRGMRATARRAIDRVFFADERERVSIQATEHERARLSRELHDDPLQAIAGVILRLEHHPDTDSERETLRNIAAQLRGVATQLHPPVLDDLGLVPAVHSLFNEPGPIEVSVEIDNAAGYGRSRRPPMAVELAAYRIIQEAAANAIRHSGCRHLTVRGWVNSLDLAIDVVDDGKGFRSRQIDDAMLAGHIGVASMRRRAEAIDARLDHESTPGAGTVVSLRWTA